MILGLDTSHFQGNPNMAAAKASGREFIVLKATEGTGYADTAMTTNRANAHAAGLLVGFYHFAGSSSAKIVYEPTAEADYFIRTVGALQSGEFVALDFEPFGYTNLGSYDMVQWAKTWLDRVTARLGVRPLIYMSTSHLRGYNWTPIASTYGLWFAVYDNAPAAQNAVPYWGVPAMKQHSDKGSVPGVAGTCDVDSFFGSRDQLLAYGHGSADMPLTQADADLVAATLLNRNVNRAGGPTGTTNLAATLAWLDANLGGIPAAVVNRQVSGTRPLWQVLADLDSRSAQPAPPQIDTAALARQIIEALPAAQAAEVAKAVVDQLGQRIVAPPTA